MSEPLTIIRWETPVSDVDFLMSGLRYYDWILDITLDPSTIGNPMPRTNVKFSKPTAFRSMVEQYRSRLWGEFSKTRHPGRTFIIKNSPWVAAVSKEEAEFSIVEADIKHYVIACEIEVIEILARYEPAITNSRQLEEKTAGARTHIRMN